VASSEHWKVTILYDAVEDKEDDPRADAPVHQQVRRALEGRGHEVRCLAAKPKIRSLVEQLETDNSDIIFNVCESLDGVDRHSITVAALLELMGKPFTGAGSVGLTLALDKGLAKKILSFHNIRSPRFSTMDSGQVEWSDDLEFPLFVKPLNADSSVGIDEKAIVRDVKELMQRISYIHTEIGSPALIEEFIEGRELYVGILGNDKPDVLPVLEWDFSNVTGPGIATAKAKWDKDSAAYKAPEVFPEDIPEATYQEIQRAALEACRALKIFDYCRVDLRLRRKSRKEGGGKSGNGEWEFFLIEVNPNPYLHNKSEFALAARKKGLSYPDMVQAIIEAALKRKR
jgi:D-alanine-D-alanine ligase